MRGISLTQVHKSNNKWRVYVYIYFFFPGSFTYVLFFEYNSSLCTSMQSQRWLWRLKTAKWRTNMHGFMWYVHIAWTSFVASPSLDRRLRTAHWRRITFMFAWEPSDEEAALLIAHSEANNLVRSFLIFLSFHRHGFLQTGIFFSPPKICFHTTRPQATRNKR